MPLELHRRYLGRSVRAGDRVLGAGAGPGCFTIELARLCARVTMGDVSPVQLELNERKLREAGLEDAIEERIVADVTELDRFADGGFDAAVAYGGPLSYALDRAPRAALVRWGVELCAEAGAVESGPHVIVVARTPA